MATSDKTCQNCGKTLNRNVYGSRMESFVDFHKRKYCNRECSYHRQASTGNEQAVMAPEAARTLPPLPKDYILPLDYLLRILNDPNQSDERRIRAAIAALPYCHAKKTNKSNGIKGDRAEAARQASAGRFASGMAPKKVVPISSFTKT
jgi:hypothetical protein